MHRKFPVLILLMFLACLHSSGQKSQSPWISITPIPPAPASKKIFKSRLVKQIGDTSFLVIKNIDIYGNKRTRREIVLRELNLHPGDTMYATTEETFLEEKRQRLLNSSLFLTVNIYPVNKGPHQTDLNVEVLERQYFLILPLLSLVDRNFNVWWVKHNHSLNRLNYGIKMYENNFTGSKDQLKASFTLGYTQQFALSYNFPYFDKAFHQGLGIYAAYSRNRELNYEVDSNKQNYFKQDRFIKRYFTFGLNYTYKKEVRLTNRLSLYYNNYWVDDTVLQLNPHFFPDHHSTQRYLELNYSFSYIGTDIWAYPLHGYSIEATLSRNGFGLLGKVNETKLSATVHKYWELFPNTYLENDFSGSIRLPAHQPYFLFKGMGFAGQYLRGLEYYVVEGDRFGILSNSIKKQFLAFRINSRFLPEEFASIPVRMYFKMYGDFGYNHSSTALPESMLSNKLLYSYGMGLDVVTFYDAVLRVEYSFNQLGEKGVFLHFKSTF